MRIRGCTSCLPAAATRSRAFRAAVACARATGSIGVVDDAVVSWYDWATDGGADPFPVLVPRIAAARAALVHVRTVHDPPSAN